MMAAPLAGVRVIELATFITGPYAGIGRGFGAYHSLQEMTGLYLPAGACDALPDARQSLAGRVISELRMSAARLMSMMSLL